MRILIYDFGPLLLFLIALPQILIFIALGGNGITFFFAFYKYLLEIEKASTIAIALVKEQYIYGKQ